MEAVWWVTATAAVGSFASQYPFSFDKSWFKSLNSKYIAIPDERVFATVWPTLFFLTAIAYSLLAAAANKNPPLKRTRSQQRKATTVDHRLRAMIWLNVNLAVNFLWSTLFFGWHWKGWAVVDGVACWASLLMAALDASRVNKWAFYLLIPHLLWLTFGTVLSFSIWMY